MKELKTKVIEVIDKINNDWVEALKLGEEEDEGIDLTQMFGKFSNNMKELDQYFREAEERQKKKKGIFG